MKSLYKYFLVLLLLADVLYSLVQHYHMPLDGDMACIIMPSDGYKHLMSDPLGINASQGEVYAGTNRFFAHWTMSTYFRIAPIICQSFINPIDSIYLSCAIAKTGIQVLIIFILSVFISNTWNVFKKDFLLAAVLITPLFQTWGFNGYLGIIDKSITYTFFYALPLGLLMLFFVPFYKSRISNQGLLLNPLIKILLVPLILFLSLNGPLVPAVVLIVCALLILSRILTLFLVSSRKTLTDKLFDSILKVSGIEIFYFGLFCTICLYSLYIGKFNAENFNKTIPLLERYSLLLKGLFYQFTKSLGPPLLLVIIATNTVLLIKKNQTDEVKRLLTVLKWIVVFSIFYTILLPFGGYREYRPFIIRWDTFMPINLCLFYYFGISSLTLINLFHSRIKLIYLSVVGLILLIFTIADKTDFNASTCEKESLKTISKSTDKIILLDSSCPVMAWGKITNYNDSKFNTQYLNLVGVLKSEKYYYQK